MQRVPDCCAAPVNFRFHALFEHRRADLDCVESTVLAFLVHAEKFPPRPATTPARNRVDYLRRGITFAVEHGITFPKVFPRDTARTK